ncbi:MAG TPA: glycosyltransferase family 4 protein [Gaiellaceae bacterium]|nr:glycosyltransferase family 4 protein [Gaiellaceae bacterium]
MKVVSVMTTESPAGGAEFAAVEMLDALIDRGHETVMLTNQPGLGRDRRVRVVDVDLGPKLSLRTYVRLLASTPSLLRQLRRALEREWPYDVLLVHYKKEQLIAPLLPKRLRPRIVWAEWGPVPFPLRRGIARRLYVAASARASAILAVSEGTRASVMDVGVDAGKVIVVPNVMRADEIVYSEAGRERIRRALGIGTEDFVVGCISRFHPKKRNEVVVEAVLRLDDPRVHLILAGSGETEQALRRLAEPLGDRFHIVAPPGADVADVASAFDVAVFCPSPTEGMPRAVILGMLAERPCISTGAEGVADLISPEFGAITSPENDAAALTRALQPYVADPDRVRREGKLARESAEATFAAPVVAQRLEQILRPDS